MNDRPAPPSLRAGRELPAPLEALVMSSLEKEPARRPTSMDELIAALDALDLEPWTDARARAWWREHAHKVRAATSHPSSSAPSTVAVDLARRQAAALQSTRIA